MESLKEILKAISKLNKDNLREFNKQKALLKIAKEELDKFKIPRLKPQIIEEFKLALDCLKILMD